jgi:hypothetical protein
MNLFNLNNHWYTKCTLKPSKRQKGRICNDNVWVEHTIFVVADALKRNVVGESTKKKDNRQKKYIHMTS